MASLAVSNAAPKVGDSVGITGSGFEPADVVTLRVPLSGFAAEIVADAGGYIGSTDEPDHATATLTSTGVNVSVDDTVTVGAVTYTFKAAPTTVANQVKIGTNAADSLVNLKAAVNLEAGAGTLYGSATVVHPTVAAVDISATTLKFAAKTGGTGGNSLASTEVAVTLSFGGGTFSGGAASTGRKEVVWTPIEPGTFVLQAEDASGNSASLAVRIWSGS